MLAGERLRGVMRLTGGNKMPFRGEATCDERIDGGSTRPTEEIT